MPQVRHQQYESIEQGDLEEALLVEKTGKESTFQYNHQYILP